MTRLVSAGPLLNCFSQRREAAAGHFHHGADVEDLVEAFLLRAESHRRREQRRIDVARFQGNELLDLLAADRHQNKIFRIHAEFFQGHVESDVNGAAQAR